MIEQKEGKTVQLGDKVWMYCGPLTLMVGHLLDTSPDGKFIAISNLAYDEYHRLPPSQRAQVPLTWCPVAMCSYVTHMPLEDVRKKFDSTPVGFQPGGLPFLKHA